MSVEERDPVTPASEEAPSHPSEASPARSGGRRSGLPPLLYPLLAVLFGGALVWSYSRILLAVSSQTITLFGAKVQGKGVAAVIALLVPLNVLVGAALVAYGARVRRRPASFPLLVAAGLVVVAAGVAALNISSPSEATRPKGQTVALVAQNISFQPTSFTVRAGAQVTVDFSNKDVQTQHNFVLFPGKDATGQPLFAGQIITGPATAQYSFTAPGPGTYFFHCAVHPTQMTGTVTVPPAGAGGGLQITAKNLKFSPTTLTASSGGQLTLHFVNDDPQIPHNFVLFNGSDATAPVLFPGPPVTGPANTDYSFAAPPPGTYFFHCQFHPSTMTGTLTIR